jgi:hypothetical protein
VPTMTATAGGTTTNATGPGVIVRIREVAAAGAGLSPRLQVVNQSVIRASFY